MSELNQAGTTISLLREARELIDRLHAIEDNSSDSLRAGRCKKKLDEHIAATEATAAERALAITPEWWESIGFVKGVEIPRWKIATSHHIVYITSVNVLLFNTFANIGIVISEVATTNRGMMVDFLDGLLIPHTAKFGEVAKKDGGT